MTLRRRTQLLVGLSLLAGLSVLYVSSEFWFSRSFQRAEGTEQREAMQRVLNAISRDQRELDSDAVDYAMWNDTYEFVVAPDPRYVDNNLNDSFFTAFRLDAALMIRSDGMVVWSRAFNSETKALAALPADLERDLVAQQFVRLQDPEHGVSGLLFLRNEPMLVAARPIVTSDGEGPVRGVFIMVRYLNAAYMQQLSDLTRLEVRLTPLPKALPESDTGSFLASSKSLTSAVVRPWGEDMVTGYAAVNDLHARPLGLLEVTSKRLIVAEGRGALRGTLVIFAGVALVLGVLIHRVLERSVLSPLSSLQGEVRGLRAGTGRRVALKGSSPREIQELGQIINTSISELESAERRLAQSQKVEAIGQLAGGIAHDFNNLLTVMGGCSALAASDPGLAESTREDLVEIRRAVERGSALTSQILAFARQQSLEPRVVSPADIVEGMVPLLQRLLGEDMTVITDQARDLDLVEVDPHQLEQVLLNLAVNARDAMPSGGTLTIQTANAELGDDDLRRHPYMTAGRYVLLQVIDTGIGMDEATTNRAFEPFFTTKESGRGTGLGLSTVYGIVKQSGGHVLLESEEGTGTVVKLYLPRVEGRASAAESKAASPTARSAGGETIMVVEDEDVIRSLTRRILVAHGYTVLTAASGPEALALFDECDGGIDLLLTDVVLPGGMHGGKLAAAARARCPDLAVLYMSGYPRRAKDIMFDGAHYLNKPFTPDLLASKAREALDCT